jgi:endonuclease YncB( thermonuclease family)
MRVRLAGIDAPELKQHPTLAQKARDFLFTELSKSEFGMHQIDLDMYNRPVVELWVKDVLINRKLLEHGLAEKYRGHTPGIDHMAYAEAESLAKRRRLGIWSEDNYESPQKYRKRLSSEKSKGRYR